ncbi:glycosyltransferase family 2 protein [Microvirga flavescens]|uniref:glycosyltransferase family 2 protein n=1 Tax=Microvirga flavescens TaxID=2249811 RepID=UPI000DD9F691|nr:glycosyltransferase family 2 protein [Microvirga flavescens]
MSSDSAIQMKTPSTDTVELTILMPCLNEAETIEQCVRKARDFLTRSGIAGEVLIADNGSTDGSQAMAEALGARVVPIPQRGYGAALMGGIEAARGAYIIMGDADDSYDFSSLMPFVERLRSGADLVMGNRFKGGIAPGAMPFLHRYLGNPVLSFIGRLFFNIPVGDFHCGLRGFRADAIRGLALQTTGMEFASEMVVRSALSTLRIEEVPTTLDVDGRSRAPHLKTWRDGWRHLKFLLMYSPRWLFLVPGSLLVLIGLPLVMILLRGPVHLGSNLALDVNSFIAACFLVVLGVQLIVLGAIARTFAGKAGFLPKTTRAERLFGWLSTDRLVQIAGLLFVTGLGGALWAVKQWSSVDFGPLPSPLVPRVLLLSLCTVLIGIQTAFAAFFLGILEIPFRRRQQS